MTQHAARRLLLDLWAVGIAAVEGRGAVRRHLQEAPLRGRWRIIAVGKAAAAMTLGALDVLGDRVVDALVVTKSGHVPDEVRASSSPIEVRIGGHPLPDAGSIEAGTVLLERIDAAGAQDQWLFLISGGASSLVEVPAAGVTLHELNAANVWLLGSGLPIAAVNAVRSRLSQLKAGRLAGRLKSPKVQALMISDVPGDDPAVIGSGMLCVPSPAPWPDALPGALRARLQAVPDPQAPADVAVDIAIVARPEDLRDAVCAAARERGLTVEAWPRRFEGDAHDVARDVVQRLTASDCDLLVAVGETTIRLPASPGRGGRNQHLALAAASMLAGGPPIAVLAAGSDGTDGPTEDAGALVDQDTITRGRDGGGDPHDALHRAAAGEFLEASGDLLCTGATGTNVCDVIIGVSARGCEALARRHRSHVERSG